MSLQGLESITLCPRYGNRGEVRSSLRTRPAGKAPDAGGISARVKVDSLDHGRMDHRRPETDVIEVRNPHAVEKVADVAGWGAPNVEKGRPDTMGVTPGSASMARNGSPNAPGRYATTAGDERRGGTIDGSTARVVGSDAGGAAASG
jgi:hypothetical protein